jgi:hypothetical protein
MLRPPSHGGAVNISRTNVSPAAMPAKRLLIGDAALLLEPKFADSDRESLDAVLAAYPELLGADYRRVAESANWVLYRRVQSAT